MSTLDQLVPEIVDQEMEELCNEEGLALQGFRAQAETPLVLSVHN